MEIKLDEIISGWKNLLTCDIESEPIAKQRMEICCACDDLNKTLYVCKKCNCFMVAKTRSLNSKCALGKW